MTDTPEVSPQDKDFDAKAAREGFLKDLKDPTQAAKPDQEMKPPSQIEGWDVDRFLEDSAFFDHIYSSFDLDSAERDKELAKFLEGENKLLEASLNYDTAIVETMNIIRDLVGQRDLPVAGERARDFLFRNIDEIEKAVAQAKNKEVSSSVLPTMAVAVRFGTEEQGKKGLDFLERHKGLILEGLFGQEHLNSYRATLLHLIDASSIPQASALAEQIITKFVDVAERDRDKGPIDLAALIGELLQDDGDLYRPEAASFLMTKLLRDYGFDYQRLATVWAYNSAPGATNEVFVENILVMTKLESEFKGSTKALSEEFGIQNFSRYPVRLLRRQYLERDFPLKHYGIVLFPLDDHNGAFQHQEVALGILYDELLSLVHSLRVVEAGSKVDVARRLLSLNKRYGGTQKIAFVVVGGHGSENSIDFGRNSSLHVEDLKGEGSGRTSQFFVEEPTIILASCSTGAESGIGQKLSEKLHAKVIAPREPIGIKGYHARKVDGKLDLSVEYSNSESAQTFVSGKQKGTEKPHQE